MVNNKAFALHFAIFSMYAISLSILFFKMVQFFVRLTKLDYDSLRKELVNYYDV